MTFVIRKMTTLFQKPIKGLLIDITGVLYESGTEKAIVGSVEALNSLRKTGIPFRFVTNETQQTSDSLVSSLKKFGFHLCSEEIFSPGPAVKAMLISKQLRPFLLVHPGILPEFKDCDQSSPNCVVLGDAGMYFTYDSLNKAFQLLISSEKPILISMGKGKYYKCKGELAVDVGAYTSALEYACGINAEVIGKPSKQFFMAALNDMGVNPNEAIMIGDDINSDIGGAQSCGIRAILVKTGKFRPNDEFHASVKPDAIVTNFASVIENLKSRS